MFGIEHFKNFTFGRKTHIITDHKPLLPLFQKSLTNTTPHLSEYDVQLHYQPSSGMKLSDALSRQSNHSTNSGNKTEIKGLNVSIHDIDTEILEWKLKNICEEMKKDHTIQILIRHILKGWPKSQEKCPDSYQRLLFISLWLVCVQWIGFKRNNRIIVPETLRQNTLNKLHISHLGTSKTMLRARSCVFWPGINGGIKQLCNNCEICNKFSTRQPSESLKNDLVCAKPWGTLACDLLNSMGKCS